MTCHHVVSENIIERYLEGKLDAPLRDAFETHYFDCDSCLASLQTTQAIRPVLAEMPPPAAARRRTLLLRWIGLAAAAAAVLVFVNRPEPPPQPVAAVPAASPRPDRPAPLLLADVRPAPYAPALYRDGAAAPPDFAAAMRLYQDGQWKAAAQALGAITRRTPADPAALHFQGISHLLARETDAALAALDRVIAIGPASPFEEEARFYRAQALLLAGRLPEARQELERVIERRGDYEAQARALLARL